MKAPSLNRGRSFFCRGYSPKKVPPLLLQTPDIKPRLSGSPLPDKFPLTGNSTAEPPLSAVLFCAKLQPCTTSIGIPGQPVREESPVKKQSARRTIAFATAKPLIPSSGNPLTPRQFFTPSPCTQGEAGEGQCDSPESARSSKAIAKGIASGIAFRLKLAINIRLAPGTGGKIAQKIHHRIAIWPRRCHWRMDNNLHFSNWL